MNLYNLIPTVFISALRAARWNKLSGKEKTGITCKCGSLLVLGSSEETPKNRLFSGTVLFVFLKFPLNTGKRERSMKLFTSSAGVHSTHQIQVKSCRKPESWVIKSSQCILFYKFMIVYVLV